MALHQLTKTLKRTNLLLLILSGVILIGVVCFLIFRPSILPFRKVDFPTHNMVVNHTDKKYLDTIAHLGLNRLGAEDQVVIIDWMKSEIEDGGMEVQGYLVAGDGQYLIRLKRGMTKREYLTVLPHELIHLEQYRNGSLTNLGRGIIEYKGVIYSNPSGIPYGRRPWEREAMEQGDQLTSYIKKTLTEDK